MIQTRHQRTSSSIGGASPPRGRLEGIDLLRGLVMALMALDHVRDYFTNPRMDPTNLDASYPSLFFTRWLTHLCAPVFIFLAGTGAFLAGTRSKTRTQLATFLFTRGLWLIFLELTVLRLGWTFNFNLDMHYGGVIWVIGCSMI